MMYEQVMKSVYNDVNFGEFVNRDTYISNMNKAHIFVLNQETIDRIRTYKGSVVDEVVKDGKLCMPFDNMWFDYKDLRCGRPDGTMEFDNQAVHVMKLDNNVYGAQRFEINSNNRYPFLVIASVIFSLNILGGFKFMFGVTDDEMCEHAKSRNSLLIGNKDDVNSLQLGDAIVGLFKSKLLDWKREVKFCGVYHSMFQQCSKSCQALCKVAENLVMTTIAVVGWINLPIEYTFRVVPKYTTAEQKSKDKNIKPWTWRRPHYILLSHDKIKTINPHYEQQETTHKKLPHWRRGHFRHVSGRMQDGKWIPYKELRQWVRPAWIGPKEWEHGQNIYKLIK